MWAGIGAQCGAESKVCGTGSETWSDVLMGTAVTEMLRDLPVLLFPDLQAPEPGPATVLGPQAHHPLFSPKGLQTTRKAKTTHPPGARSGLWVLLSSLDLGQ